MSVNNVVYNQLWSSKWVHPICICFI